MREQLESTLRSGGASSVLEIANQYFMADNPPSVEALWVSVIAMRAAAATNAWGKVLDWADTALSMKLDDQEALGWIHLHRGVALMYLGNVYRAEKALASFQRIAKGQTSLQTIVPFGHYNWALLMRFLKRHDEEVKRFRRAAKAFAQIGDQKHRIQCQLAIAWSYLLRGIPEPALAELNLLEPDVASCVNNDVRVDSALAWALYESLHGNLTESDTRCMELLTRDEVPARQRADIAWIMGCNSRARGNSNLALAYAEEAHSHAVQDYWPLQIERIEALKRITLAN